MLLGVWKFIQSSHDQFERGEPETFKGILNLSPSLNHEPGGRSDTTYHYFPQLRKPK